ncbi:hypothetical protein CK203_016921 [Vitis vinifera]|uniref:Uncharacterized protein n=1 Tax=Vitis vinifera TaxID=29760 RepID=A0A438JNR7_VITVI|nr:hypothetical protein CK203_016921 [Vitis vinifera]
MYVELTTPRIAAWNDFLVKQRIKLELEMLGGFGKVELVSTLAEQDETEKYKAPAVDDLVDPNENEDFDHHKPQKKYDHEELTEEETHVADYVFDESKDPSEMLCAYGGYGVTREQLQCLVGESFIDIPVISMFCGYMNAKEENPSRRHFFNPYFGVRCHTGMYAILYMQHWDGSGLNRTINSERMSLERLKFATHMVLDSENEIGEMVTTNIWSNNDAE